MYNQINQITSLQYQPARRTFVKGLTATLAWMLLPFRNMAADSPPASLTGKASILRADGGELWLIGPRRAPVQIQVGRHTGSTRMAMGSEDIVSGDGIPVHKHGREDEIIFIHIGEGTVTLGEERVKVKAGDSIFVPQGTWHGLENTGKNLLKMIWVFSPSGFEQYFRDIGSRSGDTVVKRTDEEWHQVDAKHAITYRR